jgi:5-dehydro-2-deoxygluconokinase
LQFFLQRGVVTPALRKDPALEQVHWATNRHTNWSTMRVFAFDHRAQLETLPGATPDRIGQFKSLCLDATLQVAGGQPGYGLLCDSRLGRDALYRAAGQGLWIGRPVEWPSSRPLTLEPEIGPDFGGLNEWPLDHVVKVLCFCHPDDDAALWKAQEDTIVRLFHACRRNRLEMLLEVIPSKVGAVTDDTTPAIIDRFYKLGVYPDWWKLEPFTTDAAWKKACAAITAHDPHCRGIVVLGLGGTEDSLNASFALAARHRLVKGFAVGRTIHAEPGRAWLAGEISAAQAVAQMAATYRRLCTTWDAARAAGGLT